MSDEEEAAAVAELKRLHKKIEAEAAKMGLTVDQFLELMLGATEQQDN